MKFVNASAAFLRSNWRAFCAMAIVAVAATTYLALSRHVAEADRTPVQAVHRLAVVAQPIRLQTLAPEVQLFGRVVSPERTTLASPIKAKVLRVSVLPGQHVRKGDSLIQLDTRRAEARLAQLLADKDAIAASLAIEELRMEADQSALVHEMELLDLAKASRSRFEELRSLDLESEAQFEDARRAEESASLVVATRRASLNDYDNRASLLQAQLRRVRAGVENARRDLEESSITAPFAGQVSAVYVAEGDQTRATSPLLAMLDLAAVEIQALIPSRHLGVLRGQADGTNDVDAVAMVDGRRLRLSLSRTTAAIDAGRGGVDAYFSVVGSDFPLEPGRTVDLVLSLPHVENAIAIPAHAVHKADQVFTVADERLASVPFSRIGRIDEGGEQLIIGTSGHLKDGDLLVISELSNPIDGLMVDVSLSD